MSKPSESLVGRRVACADADEVGWVVDVVRGPTADEITYVIVEPAPVLGCQPGQRLAVPWRALLDHRRHTAGGVQFKWPLSWLRNAPSFDREALPDFASRRAMAETHCFYGEPP